MYLQNRNQATTPTVEHNTEVVQHRKRESNLEGRKKIKDMNNEELKSYQREQYRRRKEKKIEGVQNTETVPDSEALKNNKHVKTTRVEHSI